MHDIRREDNYKNLESIMLAKGEAINQDEYLIHKVEPRLDELFISRFETFSPYCGYLEKWLSHNDLYRLDENVLSELRNYCYGRKVERNPFNKYILEIDQCVRIRYHPSLDESISEWLKRNRVR